MNIYSIALFLHIVGALGFFVVLSLEWIGLSQIRGARLREEADAILKVVKSSNRLGFVSMLTIVITGIYMVLTVWGGAAWILVVLGSLVLEIVIFAVLTEPRMKVIGQALVKERGSLSEPFHNQVNHPILWISVRTRMAIILGIVFLKISTPDLSESLLTIGVSIVIGLASALPVLRHERLQEGSAE